MATTTTNKLTFPLLSPDKNWSSYMESKMLGRMTYPPLQSESPPASHKLCYFKTKRRLEELINRVSTVHENIAESKRYIRHSWKNLYRMAKDFKTDITVCDDFIVENDEKRQRMRQKIQQSKETIAQKTKNIKETRRGIEFLRRVRNKMEDKISEYGIYQEFLNAVAQKNCLMFKNAKDILERFEALYIARDIIMETEQRREKHYHESKQEVQKFINEKFAKQLELIIQLEDLARKYNTAKRSATTSENIIFKIHSECIAKKIEMVTVERSCWSTYQHMKKEGYTNVEVEEGDFVGQLREIQKVLVMLGKMCKKLDVCP